MSALIDMALDDIIKQQKPRGGRRGGSAASRFRKNNKQNQSTQSEKPSRGGFRNRRGTGRANQEFKRKRNFVQVQQRDQISNSDEGVWKHDMFEQIQQEEQNQQQNFRRRTNNNNNATASNGNGKKVIVENLEFSVSEQSLKELLERVGTVTRVGINYDRSGRSLGKGFAIFDSAEGANAAVKAYNGVELDGKPIKLTLSNSNSSGPRIIISSKRGGFQRRGRGGFRGGKKSVTVEELNQQLDEYSSMQM